MDNIIYIILAAAVFIAMAGILLFIGADTLEEVGSDADDIREDDRPSDWTGNFFGSSSSFDGFKFNSNLLDLSQEGITSG